MSGKYQYSLQEAILKVEEASLVLGGNLILDKVSFEIRNITRPDAIAGQVIGLLGPSGIGKTQLFHLLSGLKKPTSGRVLIGDPGVPVKRGMVGVVEDVATMIRRHPLQVLVLGVSAGYLLSRSRRR